ncbi:unnamed protein product [Phytophthora fragariaefolia]|uniref:Unnamed protein product n=1 Tax=Phytophthora fragariaefolia TaxID=1490495 RepID=A0A9W6WKR7_9STRA|nr:unnamed protein product [Phytophthora fragariaefolia]
MPNASRIREFLENLWWNLSDGCYTMQLAHYGGKYSIERTLAFEEYTCNTSVIRVLLVIMGLPIFTCAILLCQELIPLQNPHEGWKANWGFWLRAFVLGIANGHEAITQVPPWLKVPSFSSTDIVVFSFFTGIGLVAGGVVMAEIWVFPIPFFLLTSSVILSAILAGLLRIVAGGAVFQIIASRKEELRRLNNVATLEALMCAGYPVYQILFAMTNSTPYELPVILLLSVVKLVVKRVFRSAASHEEDLIPKQVIFTVDLFDSFYLATFMQTLAATTIVAVILVDVADSAIELRQLHQRTKSVLARINELVNPSTSDKKVEKFHEVVRSLLLKTKALKDNLQEDWRVRSCITHKLSSRSKSLLDMLDRHLQTSTLDSSSHIQLPAPTFSSVVPLCGRITTKACVNSVPLNSTYKKGPPCIKVNPDMNKEVDYGKVRRRLQTTKVVALLQESLEILFTSECIVLTEYVEIIIPIIHGLFIFVTVHQPSAKYHSEMDGVTFDNVGSIVSRIFVYATFEFLSLVVLALIAKRNCGIHVLYQLAFVLETDIAFVPSKLIMWILYTLTYRVTHFGTFFSHSFNASSTELA